MATFASFVFVIIASSIASSSIANYKAVVASLQAVVASSQVAVTFIPFIKDNPYLIVVNFHKLSSASEFSSASFSKIDNNRCQ